MKKCEKCNKEIINLYGSGRFCSQKCARSYSTHKNRKNINKKISETLSKKIENGEKIGCCEKTRIDPINKKCQICGSVFKSHNKTCSKKCGNKLSGKTNTGTTHIIKDTSKMGGPREGGGRSKIFEYTSHLGESMKLNKDEIEVAKVLDKLKLKWKRNWKGFRYTTQDGKLRKYYPDFYVENKDIYIEYKGFVTEKMIHKMNESQKVNNFKLLIIYSDDERYKNMGLSLSEIKKDNKLLLNGLYKRV
jgi:hypothetical protein